MDVWKYEIIYRVEQDISLVRFAHSWDILVNTWNKFHISAHVLFILYIFSAAQWRYRLYLHMWRYHFFLIGENLVFHWDPYNKVIYL